MKTLCTALALIVVITALLAEVTVSFEEQRPVWPTYVSFRPRPPRGVGQPCVIGSDCMNGTCCVRSSFNHSKTCQRLGLYGQECSDSPIKGQVFVDHCPCDPELRCRKLVEKTYICVSRK
uniref:Putative ixodegrin protein n=1 Tax=Ixodes ricinus TaxID=34613 RepID=A0A0K8RJ44_IXORI